MPSSGISTESNRDGYSLYKNWFSVPSLKLAFGKFAEQKGRFLGERDGYSFYRFEGVAAVPQGERERPPKGEYPEGIPLWEILW